MLELDHDGVFDEPQSMAYVASMETRPRKAFSFLPDTDQLKPATMQATNAPRGLRVRILDRADIPVKVRGQSGTVTRVRFEFAYVLLDAESENDLGEPDRVVSVHWADVEPERTAENG